MNNCQHQNSVVRSISVPYGCRSIGWKPLSPQAPPAESATRRPGKIEGCRRILGRDSNPGIPTRYRRSPFFIKYAGTNLQEMMAAALGPAHLLFLHEAPTDDLVDGGLDKRR